MQPGDRPHPRGTARRHATTLAAAVLAAVGVVACQAQPHGGTGGQASIAPVPSSALLARGTFTLNGAQVVLEATGAGPNVAGTMTGSYDGGEFTVDLECARATDSGQLWIGGDVTTSTDRKYALLGTRTAIVLKRGTPPLAEFVFQMTNPPSASCLAFLDDLVAASGPTIDFQPITGSVDLAP